MYKPILICFVCRARFYGHEELSLAASEPRHTEVAAFE